VCECVCAWDCELELRTLQPFHPSSPKHHSPRLLLLVLKGPRRRPREEEAMIGRRFVVGDVLYDAHRCEEREAGRLGFVLVLL
jgi:hypothetical protein